MINREKIFLRLVNEEDAAYFIDRETSQFYKAYAGPRKYDALISVGVVMLFGSAIIAFHDAIDSFYIPRASTASNVLLLAALPVLAIVFHFRAKKKQKERFAEQRLQPIGLEDEEKKTFLEKTKNDSILLLMVVAILLPAACVLAFIFLRTSESRLFVLTGGALFAFAAFMNWISFLFLRLKIINKRLKQYGISN